MNTTPRAGASVTVRRALAALAALVLLNTVLAMRNWWPTPAVLPDARLAPEFVALWVLLLAAVAWRGQL